jgi:Ser/Thr protein kinase RdoA (MazF antagonist)
MDARLRFVGSVLPERIITGVFALIEHLAPDDVLCHSDLRPDNVIMTAQGPRLIDWLGAARAPVAYEIAQCHVLMAELDPDHDEAPEGAAVNAALQAEVARLAGSAPLALTAAMKPYLPIVRVFLLLAGAMPYMRELLLQRVEAALRSEVGDGTSPSQTLSKRQAR